MKYVYIQCGWNIDTADRMEEGQVPDCESVDQAHRRASDEVRGDEFEKRRSSGRKACRSSFLSFSLGECCKFANW